MEGRRNILGRGNGCKGGGKNGEGKGEKILCCLDEKNKRENIKRLKIFRAEEKEAIICRRKIFFCLDKKTTEKEKDQLFGKQYWFVEK